MTSKLEVKKTLGLFRDLLNASWPTILNFENILGNEVFNDFRINWLQGNWELTVEQNVLQGPTFLHVYREGADFGGVSSRVCCPDALPTHKITCHVKFEDIILQTNPSGLLQPNKLNEIIFDSFVSMTDDGWYEEASDFDCVLADCGETKIVFKFADAEFSLEKFAV